jgi:hypothetical protein
MTPQEEQMLVKVIVESVRVVLEAFSGDTDRVILTGHDESSVIESSPSSRFIDVVTPQGAFKNSSIHDNALHMSHGNRNDVREALQRFLRNTEPAVAEPKPEARQKRQLITQADILAAYKQGQQVMVLQPNAIVTPLARQIAKDKGVELR